MAERDENGRWKKGRSANPGGRKKSYGEFRKLCQEHAPEAMDKLLEVLRSKRAAAPARVRAAEIIFAYAYGKPTEADPNDGTGDKPKPLHIVIEGGIAKQVEPDDGEA